MCYTIRIYNMIVNGDVYFNDDISFRMRWVIEKKGYQNVAELGLHESETIQYFCIIIVSLLEILENFSLVLVFSIKMKSIIVLY